jgi:hypothetical protein
MLKGNYLINVDKYAIPSENVVGFKNKVKLVYEFDAADVGGSYMYPAMARSFCEAGMQFAAMFSYDPVQIAWSNTEYPTHYVSLLYTPAKALSLMIAGRAFHQLPRMKSFGSYPRSCRFDNFRVSGDEDLSEMNTASEFIYSNTTQSLPKDPGSVMHVAGCGNSPMVKYDGAGAYFLDKLETGIWRLEVYPDVLWLCDPFEATSMSRQVARLFWAQREIHISIPDLGEDYTLRSLNDTRLRNERRTRSGLYVRPGIYLATAKNADTGKVRRYLSKKETFLNGLYTPPAAPPGIYVANKTHQYAVESSSVDFRFQIAGEHSIKNTNVFVRRIGWRNFVKHPLKNAGGFDYVLADTLGPVHPGILEYCVAVDTGDGVYTFPEGVHSVPGSWDYSAGKLWIVKVVGAGTPIVLLDGYRDRKDFVFPHFSKGMRYSVDYRDGPTSDEVSLSLVASWSDEDSTPCGFQLSVAQLVKSFAVHLGSYRHIVVNARSSQDSVCTIGVVFLMEDGKNCGVDVEINRSWQGIEIPLSEFRGRRALILPNSYPLFLPKVWNKDRTTLSDKPDLRLLRAVQIIVDRSNMKTSGGKREVSFELSSINLGK